MGSSGLHPILSGDHAGVEHIRRLMLTGTLIIGLGGAVGFLGWPEIDQWVAALFIGDDGGFVLKGNPFGTLLRLGFKTIFVLGAGIALVSLLLSFAQKRPVLGHHRGRWLFLVLSLIIGPGLVANTLFKDHWGRARPYQVINDGKTFSPALVPSDQCERNCSFVSGESASIYALFFGLALMGGNWRFIWLWSGLTLGSAAGLMRMAQGGHYLSDVVFSGVFMALVVLMLSYLTRPRSPPP